MKRRYLILVVCLATLIASCSTMEEGWQGTVDAAKGVGEFVNPNPDVDVTRYQIENPNQEKLARLITPVDGPLKSLIRYVSDRDTYPDDKWLELLFIRYPWIHSMMVVDDQGYILDRIPDEPLKRINDPLVYEANWRETFLQTAVDTPELGPELYVGTPIFKDAEFAGLIIISFDPRTLFNFCPDPKELIILQSGGGVWTLNKEVDKQGLAKVPWEEILADDVVGKLETGGKYYTWLARYVGDDAYVYLTECVDPDAGGGSWFFF